MDTIRAAFAATACTLLSQGAWAEERPLNLALTERPTAVGSTVIRPQLMLDRKEGMKSENTTLSYDAKKKIIVLPALQATSGGVTTKVGVRPRKGGGEVRVQISW